MRPTSRLDLLLVPVRLDCPVATGHALLEGLRNLGIVDETGAAGPQASQWLPEGFRGIWIDDPGAVVLYANRQGGFGVRCPQTQANVLGAFSRALTAFRAGSPPVMDCPACQTSHRLDALDARPPVALGRWALVTGFVEGVSLSEAALERVAAAGLTPVRIVLRRHA